MLVPVSRQRRLARWASAGWTWLQRAATRQIGEGSPREQRNEAQANSSAIRRTVTGAPPTSNEVVPGSVAVPSKERALDRAPISRWVELAAAGARSAPGTRWKSGFFRQGLGFLRVEDEGRLRFCALSRHNHQDQDVRFASRRTQATTCRLGAQMRSLARKGNLLDTSHIKVMCRTLGDFHHIYP